MTLAHQAGKVKTNVAFELQKFYPLFTLVFTQITPMKFTVFENIPILRSGHTVKNLLTLLWVKTSVTGL